MSSAVGRSWTSDSASEDSPLTRFVDIPFRAVVASVAVLTGNLGGLGNGSRAGNHRPGRVPLGRAEGLSEDRAQLRSEHGVVEGDEDRQGVDALGEVLSGRLAEGRLSANHVEDVIAHLEHHPEGPAEGGDGFDLVTRQPTGERPDPAGGGHERGGLARDGLGIVLSRSGKLEGRVHFRDLAPTQFTQGGGQQLGDLGPESCRDLSRTGEEEVTGHDGHQVAEARVDALDVATDGGLVDHVVVVQRGQMDELDGHGPEEVLSRGRTTTGRGRGQGQGRPQALAPGGQEVGGHLVEKNVPGQDRFDQKGLESLQFVLERGQPE